MIKKGFFSIQCSITWTLLKSGKCKTALHGPKKSSFSYEAELHSLCRNPANVKQRCIVKKRVLFQMKQGYIFSAEKII